MGWFMVDIMMFIICIGLVIWAFTYGPVVGLLALIALILIGSAK